MKNETEYDELVNIIKWIGENIDGLTFIPNDEKTLLYVGCYDVTLEHQAAMEVLYKHELYGSMFSLLRILTESLVRGLWLQYSASDEEISQFKNGKVKKTFGELIEAIERSIGDEQKVLSGFKDQAWTAMNSFTHTGFMQIARRHGEGTVGANYQPEEIGKVLSVAGALGLICAAQLATISGKSELVKITMKKIAYYAKTSRDSDQS